MKRPAGVEVKRFAISRALFFLCHRRLGWHPIAFAVALTMTWAIAVDAWAGAFSVNPVRVELSAQRSSAVVQVENSSSNEVTIEARTFAWSQPEGKDQLSPTREVIVTPQVFRLKAGATQLVRIGALRKPDPHKEMYYRLMLEEIPPPPLPLAKGLQVALRISMPVFLKPPIEATDKVYVIIRRENSQQLRLSFTNSGNASAALSHLMVAYEDTPEQAIAGQSGVTYLLAGQLRELLLDCKPIDPTKKFLIRARTPTGPVTFNAVFKAE